MKRAASIILSAAMVLSLASCSLFNGSSANDSTKPSDIILDSSVSESKPDLDDTSNQGKDVVSDISFPGELKLTFEEALAATIAGFGSGYSDFLNLESMDPSDADNNKEKSISNCAHFWHRETWTNDKDGCKDIVVDVYLFEVDITSDIYEKLEAGGKIEYFRFGTLNSPVITAINGQYVLCIDASEEITGGNKTEQTSPDFSISTCQKGYEEFVNLKTGSQTNGATMLNRSLMDASTSIYNKFNDVQGKHTEFGFMKPGLHEKNLERGINQYTIGWIADSDNSKDYVSSKVLIFEMDMSSEQYKKCSAGSYIFYYETDSLKAAKISAVNGQFVLCIIASEYKDQQLALLQTSPDYSLEDAKIIYETFTGLT